MATTLEKLAIAVSIIGAVVGIAIAISRVKPATTGFQNDEAWKVAYDDQGNITDVHVSRKVSPDGSD